MKHLDLFSGIGGFALAAEMVWDWPEDIEHIFCEIDPFCQKILRKHWPSAKIYEDIRKLRGNRHGAIDLITGGFPCQPFSSAGKQKGKDDDRDLWPEMFRVIKEAKPRWVIGENVVGFIAMELERSISDLESAGYEVQSFIIPACAVEAPHRRDRVWIVAHAESAGKWGATKDIPKKNGRQKRELPQQSNGATAGTITNPDNRNELTKDKIRAGRNASYRGVGSIFNATSNHEQGCRQKPKRGFLAVRTATFLGAWKARESLLPSAVLCRTDDGIPNRVDRTKALGNAIVPQVAAEIMRAIRLTDS